MAFIQQANAAINGAIGPPSKKKIAFDETSRGKFTKWLPESHQVLVEYYLHFLLFYFLTPSTSLVLLFPLSNLLHVAFMKTPVHSIPYEFLLF